MRIIDGDELVMWLSKWMVSSFGTEPTEETKAIKTVCDAVGDMVKELERGKKGGGLIRRQDAIDAMVAEVDRIIDNICIQNVTEARLRDAVNRLPSAEPEVLAHGEGELSAESNADQRTQSVGSVDTISRQAAIDVAIQSLIGWDGMFLQEANCRIRDAINELPSEEPKTGRWIEMVDADPMTGEPYVCGVYCSECGERIGCESNFCPNCGAYMGGEQE